MILGSVGTGMLIGLTGAFMAWSGGYSPASVVLSYSVIGSLGTLVMALVSGHTRPEGDAFDV